ncbi:HNH endonuclease [Klosneuvirus KNV1]|uniref:HNH endonuclease n=1 Tax=Klosneuvirus KNV1 TaxID=1977640 RepID=A0A1V0SI59_9VIRU|nr:HNH endonuclease [Klosneuvirus KNV1]
MNWKYVAGYEERYKVYENGDVFEGDNKVEPILHKFFQLQFIHLVRSDNRVNMVSLAKLVYETFIGKIKRDFKIKYKDDDINNCHVDNLEQIQIKQKVRSCEPIKLDETKEWKPIREYEETYKISESGDVYSIRINTMLKVTISPKGYHRVQLEKDGKQKYKMVHHLVYTTFKNTELDKTKIVDHEDRRKDNNHINNLREITRSENAKNIDPYTKNEEIVVQYSLDNEIIKEWNSMKELIKENPKYKQRIISDCCLNRKESIYGFKWKYKNYIMDTTGFTQVKTDDGKIYSKYQINKNATVINRNGRQIKPIFGNGYNMVKLRSDKEEEKSFQVHRLVAITFIPNPENKPIVNHLDEDKLNNNADNLEWATHKRNTTHSIGKKVHQIDIKTGKILNTFDSLVDASEAIKKQTGSDKNKQWGIGAACSGKRKIAHGYKWKLAD